MVKQHELISVVAALNPISQSAGTTVSSYIKADKFNAYLAVFQVGTLATNNTTDFSLVQATDASGTGVKAITGKAATQLTQAGTDSDKQVIISLLPHELDLANSFQYVALKSVTATAAGLVSGVLLGVGAKRTPASLSDATTVDEIVA